MKPVIVHLKLPDDLSAKARELAGKRPVRDVILEALREQWMPQEKSAEEILLEVRDRVAPFTSLARDCDAAREMLRKTPPADDVYPFGSIPAEHKRA